MSKPKIESPVPRNARTWTVTLTNDVGCKLTEQRLEQLKQVFLAWNWRTEKEELRFDLERLHVRGNIGDHSCNMYDYDAQGWILGHQVVDGSPSGTVLHFPPPPEIIPPHLLKPMPSLDIIVDADLQVIVLAKALATAGLCIINTNDGRLCITHRPSEWRPHD